MRALRGIVWMLVGVGLGLSGTVPESQAAPKKSNKVIIYPSAGESVSSLKQGGVQRVQDYGSYWVVEATDEQVTALEKKHGARLQKADHLNRVELNEVTIDTTGAEPAVPERLQERVLSTTGKRLRLVQFNGPVQPAWLEEVKAAGNVQVINYVPNNAYLVKLDAAAEENLQALKQPAGPIQWIGAYHPFYKLNEPLRQSTKTIVPVRLAVIQDADSAAAMEAVRRYAIGPISEPRYLLNQINLELNLRATDVELVAALPGVLWIREALPRKRFDEPQALVVATSDSGPAPIRYLEFLQNHVGASQNPTDYPVLDIADTGLDIGHPAFSFPTFAVAPVNCLSILGSKVMYVFNPIDTDGHGTIVASVAAGFDDFPDEIINCYTEKRSEQCTTNLVFGCITNGFTIGGGVECSGPVPPACCTTLTCTNANIVCGFSTNVVCVEVCEVVTNKPAPPFPATVYRRTLSGELQLGLGISPFGRIGSSQGGAEDDFLGPFDHALNIYLRQARISNNSWGEICCTSAGEYDDFAQAYDALTRDAVTTGNTTPPVPGPSPLNQELLYVFSGGNANGIDGTGGFGDVLITPPATAKNVFTVGASTKTDPGGLASFTSFGPTMDGRFKPEIMAPGAGIYGATSQDSYTHFECGGCNPNSPAPGPCSEGFGLDPAITLLYSRLHNGITSYNGTSFSAPAVSGGAQLLWWYFQNRLLMLQPSPAMMKAYICNSARYMPSPNPLTGVTDQLPSSAQGMGRMDLDRMFDTVPRVIRDQSTGRAIDAPLITTNPVTQQTLFSASGQTYELSGTVADSTKPFRITLAWTDAPGTPGNGPQLVNNLDLLVSIGGKSYFGNVFDREFSKIGGIPDVINNMESVFLPPGQTGTWSVIVRGLNIAGKGVPNIGSTFNQDFALVVYNGANASDLPNLQTNDSCQTARPITSFPFGWTNNLSSTVYHNNHPSPSAGRGGVEEFFMISFPTPGTRFDVNTFGSSFNTLLSVWRGTCGNLEEVVSNNDASNTTRSAVSWTVTDTNIYYIVAEGLQNQTGTLALNVTATPPPFGFNTAVVNFGTNYVGNTTNITVTLLNQTGSHANIGDVTIGGPNAGDFAISAENCATASIPPGGSCSLTLSFSPTTTGLRTALLIVNDDITGGPHTLPLVGFGLAPEPFLCHGASGLVFSETSLGFTTTVQTVVVTNCGTANLLISSVSVTGAASNDFRIVANACTSGFIAPGDVCAVDLVFVPTAPGVRIANLRFTDNTSLGVHTVSLSGTATVPAPIICATPAGLGFGSVTLNTTGTIQSVIVSNCGSAALTISGVSLTGGGAGQFEIVNNACLNAVLPIGGTCTIGVRMVTTVIGPASANLVINGSTGLQRSIPLTGNGSGSQPDLRIAQKPKDKFFVGKDVLTPPAAISLQTVTQKAKRGKKPRIFYVRCQNNGSAPDTFTVTGSGDVAGTYSVRYFLGTGKKKDVGLEVTEAVVNGTFKTASLDTGAATGDATLLRVEVQADALVAPGTYSVGVTFRSTSSQLNEDSVQATIVVR